MNPPSGIHLCRLYLLGSSICILVLMTSWGYETIQLLVAATGPTMRASVISRCGWSSVIYLSFKYQQVANWIEQLGIYRAAVEKEPLKRPRNPQFLIIDFMHYLELANLAYLSFCITHLMSQTGATTAVTTRPAKAPFQKPSRRLIQVLFLMVLQSSQELNMTALTRGMVSKGQQIPLKSLIKPSYLMMIRKVCDIVRFGFICILTLTVSKMQPELQLATPEMLPQAKSTRKFSIISSQLIILNTKNNLNSLIKLTFHLLLLHLHISIQMFAHKQLLLFLSTLLLLRSQNIGRSPLSLCDNQDTFCDIRMNVNNKTYSMSLSKTFLAANNQLFACFRKRQVSRLTNNECELTSSENTTHNYNCLGISYNKENPANSTVSNYYSDQNLVPSTSDEKGAQTFIVTDGFFILNGSLEQNAVYEIQVGLTRYISADSNAKRAFLHTFYHPGVSALDGNILMQRNYACLYFYYGLHYNYNLIFYGGVLRSQKNYMYMSFLSYLSDDNITQTEMNALALNMWGCLSFGNSHASRDMIGFSSGAIAIYDMFSLYFAAPFLDASSNINGTADLSSTAFSTVITNSTSRFTYFYFMSVYRLYDTLDTRGDQMIFKRQNQQFCYAVGYNVNGSKRIHPYEISHSHQYTACFKADITVCQTWPLWTFLNLMLVLICLQ